MEELFDAVQRSETDRYRNDPPDALVLFIIGNSLFVTMHAQYAVAAFATGTFDTLRNHQVSLSHSLLSALSRTWGIVVLAVLETATSTVAYGYSAAVGLMISLLWVLLFYVAIPAMMVEGIGPIAALGRSKALSKGHRGPIFGIVTLVFMIRMLSWLLVIPFAFLGLYGLMAICILIFLTNTILPAIAMGVVYHDLREAKEGLSDTEVEDVFA